MQEKQKRRFHRLFGARKYKHKPKINYAKSDFLDYVLMMLMCAAAIYGAYGREPWLCAFGVALCFFMIVSFSVRHGVLFKMPLLLRRPQEIIYLFAHKIENLPRLYWPALGLVLLENVLIQATPSWPHHVEFMRQVGFGLLYLHLGGFFIYRTVSLVDHWRKHDVVSSVLLQSPWKNVGLVRGSIRYEIVHAYVTGLLAHLILVLPWYLVLTYLQFSVLFTPLVCVLNLALHGQFYKAINAWFYRDHWLGHNSELDFLYLHGGHHDAIPLGLIAVGGNGFLEGLFRNGLGYPSTFYNPLIAFFTLSMEVKSDIDAHQFVPGIFPRLPFDFRKATQHSTHHFGHLEPYGFAINADLPGLLPAVAKGLKTFPDEFCNSIALDEELGQFEWDNPRHEWFIKVCEEHE
ncbi:hypothetical protein GCN74_05235 [Janthinobacterium sp. FT14W]|uniref:hypothetical protein n=1 Tax=Janthinobacterium sp. FT14W TaxID=2654253 RepID=UPI001264152E|nr:hypothetical protein [Janthinobacterium sp. FT14W]KAB8061471.1 hypothetical protein GCN74_05235 [Janthinobacterium sp. FT14W]